MSVLLSGFSDSFFYDVALGLLQSELKISCVTTFTEYEQMASDKRFNNIRLINYAKELEYPKAIGQLNVGSHHYLSADLLEALWECESVFLSISDRHTHAD